MTMISGSTAAGETIPPHLQFLTMAQSKEKMWLQTDIQQFISYIRGTFGRSAEKNLADYIWHECQRGNEQ